MRLKRNSLLRTFVQLSGQFVTYIVGGFFRIHRRRTSVLVDARALVAGITMAVLPGCAFLTFVDEQDTGKFLVTQQVPDEKEKAGTLLPDDVTVDVEWATWWTTEVLVRVKIRNDSSEPLQVSVAETTLTFLEPIQQHYVRTPAYCAVGEECLLAEAGLQVEQGPWQKVRPFGDVAAARRAAETKASLPSGALDAPFIVPAGKAAVVKVEFEAPRMELGEFALGVQPSGHMTSSRFRYELRRPSTRATRRAGQR